MSAERSRRPSPPPDAAAASFEPIATTRTGNSMRGLDGKTAIISGGATLIGQAVAATLIGYGAKTVIADINEADGAAAAEKLGPNASFIRTDITDDADIAALVAKTVETTGRLD